MSENIVFIGVGNMGNPMACNLKKAGKKIKVFEDGKVEQTVLIEFESFEKAAECIDSKEYQDALAALDGGANRDCRVFEGL